MERSLGILSVDPGPSPACCSTPCHPCVCGCRSVVVGRNGCDFYRSNRSVHHKKGGQHGQA